MTSLSQMISDHLSTLINKFIVVFGWSGFGVGTALGIVNDTASKVLEQSAAPWTLPDYAAVVSMVAGATVVLKNLVDFWLTMRKLRAAKAKVVKGD